MFSTAQFSKDRVYRYSLSRVWDEKKPWLTFILLNPSTADETMNDPTVSRCLVRTHAMGRFGRMCVLNLFALRSTDPKAIQKHVHPVGPCNDSTIDVFVRLSDMVICGWGHSGSYQGRGKYVLNMVRLAGKIPYALKLNKSGAPQHPLYLPYKLQPFVME
jgi:hypothetical protein